MYRGIEGKVIDTIYLHGVQCGVARFGYRKSNPIGALSNTVFRKNGDGRRAIYRSVCYGNDLTVRAGYGYYGRHLFRPPWKRIVIRIYVGKEGVVRLSADIQPCKRGVTRSRERIRGERRDNHLVGRVETHGIDIRRTFLGRHHDPRHAVAGRGADGDRLILSGKDGDLRHRRLFPYETVVQRRGVETG